MVILFDIENERKNINVTKIWTCDYMKTDFKLVMEEIQNSQRYFDKVAKILNTTSIEETAEAISQIQVIDRNPIEHCKKTVNTNQN